MFKQIIPFLVVLLSLLSAGICLADEDRRVVIHTRDPQDVNGPSQQATETELPKQRLVTPKIRTLSSGDFPLGEFNCETDLCLSTASEVGKALDAGRLVSMICRVDVIKIDVLKATGITTKMLQLLVENFETSSENEAFALLRCASLLVSGGVSLEEASTAILFGHLQAIARIGPSSVETTIHRSVTVKIYERVTYE